MPRYTCTKCGETAISKNPATRNTFPDHYLPTVLLSRMYCNVVQDPLSPDNKKKKDLVFNITKREDESKLESIHQFFKVIRSMDETELKILECSLDEGHAWHSDDPPDV